MVRVLTTSVVPCAFQFAHVIMIQILGSILHVCLFFINLLFPFHTLLRVFVSDDFLSGFDGAAENFTTVATALI